MSKPERKNFHKKEPKEFEEEVIQIDRVTRVVKGGRRLRFRATVVIGDKKGRIGYGIGKSVEVPQAIQKAVSKAKKNLVKIPIYNGTIPHGIQIKFKASIVLLKPASEGTGIIAGGAVRKLVDIAGIKNILSKTIGSSNKLNNTKAAYIALTSLRERPELEKKNKAQAEAGNEDRADAKVQTITKSAAKEMAKAGQVKVKKTAPNKKTA
ncbi:30S ribosomal protein S5 [Candidatus Peregrinibacteria bacterium]|nr:30S ribosomal protein S5 [Candidatus Peregrinibacteria bacterium]